MFNSNGVDQRTVDLRVRPHSPIVSDAVSLSGRTQVDPASILSGRTVNIIFVGQSTNQNTVQSTGTFTHNANIFNLSIAHRGACFIAKEPLLVSSESDGHHGMYLADQLIDDDVVDNVLLTNIAIGGSNCAEWCPGGGTGNASHGGPAHTGLLAYRIGLAARCIANVGLSSMRTIIDWQQGEWDTYPNATSGANYQTALQGVINEFKRVGLLRSGNVMFVNQCTNLNASSGDRNPIRAAQAAVCDEDLIRFGADIDTLDSSHRYDTVHFTTAGAAAQAALKATNIADYLENG